MPSTSWTPTIFDNRKDHTVKTRKPPRSAGPAGRPSTPEPATSERGTLPKSRGAQPGNTNAVKHGFYSAAFKAHERSMLADLPLTDLSAEIDLIRITNHRFLQALKASKGDLDLQTQLTALRAVNLSAHSIATLLRAHALTAALDEETAEALRNLPPLDDDDDPLSNA
jgi:hypothetical protein